MKLCIIITGLIRTFFNQGRDELQKVIHSSFATYNKIHIVMVISGKYDNRINEFITQRSIQNITVDVIPFDTIETSAFNNAKINNNKYIQNKNKYLSADNLARREIENPDNYLNGATYQFYQLKKGIDKMKEYETSNNMSFDVCMKTRFDVKYPIHFYPFVHNETAPAEDKIFLNNENREYFKSIFHNVHDIIHFLKQENITLPQCRTPYYKFSFGGSYLNNYISLENIANGSNKILYMYNDHVIFGNRENFIDLDNLFDEYGMIDSSLNIHHYYAPEAQLLMYCFKRGINPIMYLHDCYTIIR